MIEETLHHRGTTLARRMRLKPGEATRWHIDPFHRVSVVLKGDVLAIEFRDGRLWSQSVTGTGWLGEPGHDIHQATNIGDVLYEETVFFLAHPNDVPQPGAAE
jgi:hypothetical protein